MNRYGTEAPEHWPAYLPGSYGRLEDPEEFFTELGEQADVEIEDRYLSNTRGRMSPGEERATAAEAEQRAQAAEADRTERLTYAIRSTLTWAG